MSERVYVVIPKTVDSPKPPYKFTMTCGRMAAHAAHVAGVLQHITEAQISDTDLIVLSVPNSEALGATATLLRLNHIPYVEYFDEDKAFEGTLLTAIATYPIIKERGAVLKHLRPWKCACNDVPIRGSSEKEQSVLTDGSLVKFQPPEPISNEQSAA